MIEDNDTDIRIGWSCLNPLDEFSKSMARDIATQRLHSAESFNIYDAKACLTQVNKLPARLQPIALRLLYRISAYHAKDRLPLRN